MIRTQVKPRRGEPTALGGRVRTSAAARRTGIVALARTAAPAVYAAPAGMVAAAGSAELATAAAPVEPAEALTVRPASPADIAALRAFFTGLSVLTRHRRFFAAITPTTAMLLALVGGKGNVDAVVAVRRGVIVGHAMAADQAHEPDGVGGNRQCNGQDDLAADIGIVVADTWQGTGVGSALMRTLVARASARGVTNLTMNVLPDNRRVLAMITSHWPTATAHLTEDSIALRVQL